MQPKAGPGCEIEPVAREHEEADWLDIAQAP